MKRIIIYFLLMTAVGAIGLYATEEAQVLEFVYNASPTHLPQLGFLILMKENNLSGMGEFYTMSLRYLVSKYKNIKNDTEKRYADEQAILLLSLLGKEKYTQAADDLWKAVNEFTNPLVKVEALIALGRIRATAYLPQIIRLLESTNAKPTDNRLDGEIIALGAIIALEKYRDPSGYAAVNAASTGWYSERVKSQAAKTLQLIPRR